jgi:polyisoprenoid-binding protein YceI
MTDMADEAPAALLSGGKAAGHWVLDPAGSSVRISHKVFWGLLPVRGSFSELSGEGDVTQDGSVSGRIEIGAASIDTKNKQRDTHLRSADFFKADEHPSIVFTASEAKLEPSSDLTVSGELEAGGVSRPLPVTAKVTQVSPDSATLSAEADVDRASYGMTWNMLGIIRGVAHVSVVARFTKQPAS